MIYRLLYCYPKTELERSKLENIKRQYQSLMDNLNELDSKSIRQQFIKIADSIYNYQDNYFWMIWEYVNRQTSLLFLKHNRDYVVALNHYLQKIRPKIVDDFNTIFTTDLTTLTYLTHSHPEITCALRKGLETLDLYYTAIERSKLFPTDIRFDLIMKLDKDRTYFSDSLLQKTEERLLQGHFDTFSDTIQEDTRTLDDYFHELGRYYQSYVKDKTHLRELLELTETLRRKPYYEIKDHHDLIELLSLVDKLQFNTNDPQLRQ